MSKIKKIVLIIMYLFIYSCATPYIKNKNNSNKLLSYILNNYCNNYKNSDIYSIKIEKSSIFIEAYKHYFLYKRYIDIVDFRKYEKDYLTNKTVINHIIPKPNLLLKEYDIIKRNSVYDNEELVLKKFWMITIKKELKREYYFDGTFVAYYQVNKFFVDENISNLFYNSYITNKVQLGKNNIQERIYQLLKEYEYKPITEKSISPKTIDTVINKIISKLNIYISKKLIKIEFIVPNNTLKILVAQNTFDNYILILIDLKTRKIVNLKFKGEFNYFTNFLLKYGSNDKVMVNFQGCNPI